MTRSNSFGDVDFHQKKEKLREEIWQVINDLQDLHQNGFYKIILQKCRGAITPLISHEDASRLPSVLKARNARKTDCVVAAVCRMITFYWVFYQTGEEEQAVIIECYLGALKEYVANGLDAYDVKGNANVGHVLVEKE